ncbi:MAG: Gfo/Idh/MocA family oxidoreductase [Chloroflexi bacterium]|nr:Gfo/Idh/MocA family oxidoreductase [Chloroflexota bacterium]
MSDRQTRGAPTSEQRRQQTLGLPDWREWPNTVEYRAESTRRVRAGFVGCGGHSYRNIYSSFHWAPVDLIAVADVDLDRAKAYAREFGAERAYADYREMLARENLDCVFVVTNYDERGRPRFPGIAMDIMRAGANAWIEKPPAANLAEVEAMQAVERQTGRFTQVGYKKMFVPTYIKAKEISQRPEFGGARQLSIRYPQRMPPPETRYALDRDPLAVGFLDHVWHPFAVIQYLMGDAQTMSYVWDPQSRGFFAQFTFSNGAVASLHSSGGQAAGAPLEHVELMGDGSHVVVDNIVKLTYYRKFSGHYYGRSADFFTPDESAPIVWEPEMSLGVLYNRHTFLLGYANEIRAFCDSVLNNRPPERAGLRDTHTMMQIYEGFRQPAGTTVEIKVPVAV